LIRSQVLYPAELRARICIMKDKHINRAPMQVP